MFNTVWFAVFSANQAFFIIKTICVLKTYSYLCNPKYVVSL